MIRRNQAILAGRATEARVRNDVASLQDDGHGVLDKDKACWMCSCPSSNEARVRNDVGSLQDDGHDVLDKDTACRMCSCPSSNHLTQSSKRIQVLAWAKCLKLHAAVIQHDGKWACSACAWSGWKPKSLCAALPSHILAYTLAYLGLT